MLKEGPNGLYDLGHARLQKPRDGVFLKGRTLHPHHTLQTGQPLWLVKADGEAARIGALEGSEQFRLVYRPPEAEECRHLQQRDLIWHGHLTSRAFHGRGQID